MDDIRKAKAEKMLKIGKDAKNYEKAVFGYMEKIIVSQLISGNGKNGNT